MAVSTPITVRKSGSTTVRQPRVLVTMGDPAGIGPEVVLKALAQASFEAEVTVVGNVELLESAYQQLRGKTADPIANPNDLKVLNVPVSPEQVAQIHLGVGNAASGDASFRTLRTAIERCLAEGYDAIATAPIAKSAWHMAGHTYPGQTEVLAEAAGIDRFGMLFVARSPHSGWTLRTLLATTHIPLRAVPDTLTPALMTQKLDLLVDCLRQQFGIEQPKVVIAGLNPHSGEQGKLGTEELDWLENWLQQQRQRLPQVTLDGLIPPDTLWVKPGQAWYGTGNGIAHDGYLALYHDQGLIPVKLLAFDRAVNTTIGLPFIRTSPDHGTAFDIAGQGVAQADSMIAALALATELSHLRS
ncbi:MAG: 4-hydroxythreonine-4-phosphate dehydrogenase PdxA [Cyanobacteria bacterium P01_D01_bin.14]